MQQQQEIGYGILFSGKEKGGKCRFPALPWTLNDSARERERERKKRDLFCVGRFSQLYVHTTCSLYFRSIACLEVVSRHDNAPSKAKQVEAVVANVAEREREREREGRSRYNIGRFRKRRGNGFCTLRG